jgi:hypothetical protein
MWRSEVILLGRVSRLLSAQMRRPRPQSAMSASRLSRWAASVGVRGWRPGQREASLCLKIMGF